LRGCGADRIGLADGERFALDKHRLDITSRGPHWSVRAVEHAFTERWYCGQVGSRASIAISKGSPMELTNSDDPEKVHLTLTRDEFDMISGCVMAAIDEVPDWEFSSRLPGDVDAACAVRKSLWSVHDQLPPRAAI